MKEQHGLAPEVDNQSSDRDQYHTTHPILVNLSVAAIVRVSETLFHFG